jgi:glycosyltransferase involved in cell wall biosynthesis
LPTPPQPGTATPDEQDAPALSAIVLCYRAGQSILRVIDPLYEQAVQSGVTFELVLVANFWEGRDDDTPQVVEEFCRTHDHVTSVIRPKEGGMGWDMRSGLEAARGRILIVIDGDAQNPVEDVLRMYQLMASSSFAVMKGRRVARFDGNYRRFVSIFYNGLFRLLFRSGKIWDINGKPKGVTRAAYDQMTLTSNDWFIDAEIILAAQRLGLSIGEMDVTFLDSERGSFVRFSAIGEFLLNMVSFRFRGRPKR